MTKLHLNEIELAKRWGVSPKTLQRWRTENRGPAYLKLSKRVTYPIEDIVAFEASQKRVRENSHEFAAQRAANQVSAEAFESSIQGGSQPGMTAQSTSPFISDADAARATNLPRYYFTNATKRAEMKIPHYLIGRLVRFKLEEILQWEVLQTHRCRVTLTDPIAAIFEKANAVAGTPDPASSVSVPADTGPVKMTLKEALRLKNCGSVVD